MKINNIASKQNKTKQNHRKQANTAEVHQNYTEKEQGEKKSSFETKKNNKKYKNNQFAILKHIYICNCCTVNYEYSSHTCTRIHNNISSSIVAVISYIIVFVIIIVCFFSWTVSRTIHLFFRLLHLPRSL